MTSGNGTNISETANESFTDGDQLTAGCKSRIADGVRSILQTIGEHADPQGTADTPTRVANMYDELLGGYSLNPEKVLNNALFDVES